jgi:hypothetical protein
MRDLLQKTEHLNLFKVNEDLYLKNQNEIWAKLKDFDALNKENHCHYIQIENYIDKYLPLKY